MNDNVWHVAIVMPVVHYTMGGLQINTESQVTNERGHPIAGLYAAGEVAGGIHVGTAGGHLLDCVVFGRVAGDTASRDLLQTAIKALRTGVRPDRTSRSTAWLTSTGTSTPELTRAASELGVAAAAESPRRRSPSTPVVVAAAAVSAGALTEAEVAKTTPRATVGDYQRQFTT